MRAIFLLFLLNLRGKTRRSLSRLREPGPLILAVIVGLVMAFLFLTLLRSGSGSLEGATIAAISPIVMLLMLGGSMVSPQAQRQLFFSSAEVAFLFPGPFSRRHLLALKWVQGLVTAIMPALVFSFWMRGLPGGFLTAFVALWLIFLYLAAVGLTLRFIAALVTVQSLRVSGLVILVALFLIGAWQAAGVITGGGIGEIIMDHGLDGAGEVVRSTWLGVVLLAPFEPFGRLLGAETGGEFLRWGSACIVLYGGLVGFLFWADIDFRESSLRSSARLEKQMENVKRGQFGLLQPAKGRRRIALPPLPAFGGAGAIMWRQLLLGLRGMRGAMAGFLLPLGMVVVMITLTDGLFEAGLGESFIWGILVWVSVSFSGTGLTCDFRADMPHMDLLKTLPMSPMAIAVAQVLSPALLLWFLQLVALALLAMIGAVPPAMAALAAAGFLPFNLLLFMAENLAILLFPLHPEKAGVSQVTVRGFFVFLIKGAVIGVIGLVAGGLGGLVYFASGSPLLGIGVGGLVVFGAFGGCLFAIAAAFSRFDPSRHAPSEEG